MPNHLSGQTSPYLLQHAGNPVDWYPWSAEAFELARRLERPVLLSIGYSACHWCHVMAHESFEDAAIAATMNRLFVNIKVDREERPDIDQIYQSAHALMSQRNGGWPLTMFLTPDGKPFWGGTYFPDSPRHGLPGFGPLCERVAAVYAERRAEIDQQSAALVAHLAAMAPLPSGAATLATERCSELARRVRDALLERVDRQHGGFGRAPKFPHPFELTWLLEDGAARRDAAALEPVLLTLRAMADGGLFDQLGGGFFRYSTDQDWSIPHFEKMLYDNASLLRLYADAWLTTGEARFADVCAQTSHWLEHEMRIASGGFCSSLDADSDGHEGKYYVWQPAEFDAALAGAPPEAKALVRAHFGLARPANFESSAWHLRIAEPAAKLARADGRDAATVARMLADARTRLYTARGARIRPGRDDKILTSWNAMTIEALARAGRLMHRDEWIDLARQALDFLHAQLWRDGRLLATHKDGRSHLNAYLDDHALLAAALLEIMQAGTVRPGELRWALQLAELLLAQFEDREHGGFFFTSHDHEPLIVRAKPGYDNATPSGNALAALVLQRLGHLVGDPRYLRAAERTMQLFAASLDEQPSGFATLARALAEAAAPPTIVVLTGPTDQTRSWQRELARRPLPHALVFALDPAGAAWPAAFDKPHADSAQAWICRGPQCLAPKTQLGEILSELTDEAS